MDRRFFPPLLLFFVLLLLLVPATEVRAAPSFTSMTIYVWWQGDGNFTPSQVLVGDRVMLKFTVTGFTRIYSPVVKDPQGNVLPTKNSTWTVSPYYLWFNTTSLAGRYTVSVTANDTSTNTITTYNSEVFVYPYQTAVALMKGLDVDGNSADFYTLPTPSGNIKVSATFFTVNKNGTVTASVPCSAATPFMLKLMSGSNLIAKTDWIHPKGVQTISVTFNYPVANSTHVLYGKNDFTLQVVPYYGTAPSVSLGSVYFVPADSFTPVSVSFAATVPSSAKVGDLFNVTPQMKITSSKKLVGSTPAYPVVLNFVSPQKSAIMWPSNSTGGKLLLLNNTQAQISKFVGELPVIGSNTLEVYPVTLKSFLAGQFAKIVDSSGQYKYASATVKILPDGTFSISVLNSTGKVPAEVHADEPLFMNITWTRNKYWIYSGDSYSIPVIADVEISSYAYHKGMATLTASNGTTAKLQVRLDPVNRTFSTLSASGTPYLKLKATGDTLATGSSLNYKFAGYNVKFMFQGQPYTPSSSAPINLKLFYNNEKIYETNVTSSYIYLYTVKGPVSLSAECKPTALSKLYGSASLSGVYGSTTDVVVPLSSVSIQVGPYEYIPKAYTDKISVAIRASLQPDIVYSLYNNLTALTDVFVDSSAVSVSWDANKNVATITTTTAGTYTFTYDATGTYVDNMPIATIKDQKGNLISQVRLKLVEAPGYDIKIEPIGSDKIKLYIVKATGAFPLVAGKSIRLDVGPSALILVKAVNATRVTSLSDYSWYIEPGGYLIYQIPAGNIGAKVLVSANATLPLDFSPALSLYNWVISSQYEVSVSPTPTVLPGVPTGTALFALTLLLVFAAIYVVLKKK
jgi:hypothetical protein